MTMRLTTEATAGKVELDQMGAMKRAWIWYLGFLALPLVLVVFQSWPAMFDWHFKISPHEARVAFLATLVWIGITGPIGFLGQEFFFASYFRGVGVSPHDYLRGKIFVWSLLGSGAVLAALFIWLSQSMFPHMFSIAIVYPFLLTQYPDGRAMTYLHGDKDQAGLYAEPK